jgi:hypothetical protein
MRKVVLCVFLFLFVFAFPAISQCSICSRTAEQLGEKPARGLNTGILYLAMAPLAIAGFIGFRWWKNNQGERD